ncbi:hypothetical protein AVEN_24026-1 [Araneus ventricosus]|uniref:Uncharacterized protein n=1 Tax=Araneus ventricosus TaxID=182803 RepID=A0A4Y2KEU8_ARAVE|nr:hypothetical protein AVEN_190039-1 [Araneus ventricosus]GBN00509.1 hypothetical protein AVEN_244474-1 [Araneus ventricosus]GBN00520.1 hypothetical protein AVEN_267886-1 [Araneus ventricosus]GBN00547.1 hypothetical protein AVEN_24026-1 [Araneus ventricosus]
MWWPNFIFRVPAALSPSSCHNGSKSLEEYTLSYSVWPRVLRIMVWVPIPPWIRRAGYNRYRVSNILKLALSACLENGVPVEPRFIVMRSLSTKSSNTSN